MQMRAVLKDPEEQYFIGFLIALQRFLKIRITYEEHLYVLKICSVSLYYEVYYNQLTVCIFKPCQEKYVLNLPDKHLKIFSGILIITVRKYC